MKPKRLEIACTGYSVVADWYEGKRTDRILLNLIGWTSNRARFNALLSSIVQDTGMSALVFDYSGHGDSPFDLAETTPAQHFLEVITVFDQLRAKHPKAKITVMGSSYGGFLAVQLTKYREFDKLILRAPAIYKPEDFYTPWAYGLADEQQAQRIVYRKDKAALAAHPLLARALGFKGKTLVIVHGKDEIVPKQTTDAYIAAFRAESYVEPQFKHTFDKSAAGLKKTVAYRKAITDWLNK